MTELYDFLLLVLLPILVALLLVALLVGIGAIPNAYFRVAMSGWPRLAKEYAYTGPPLPARVCWLTPLLGAWLNTVPLRIGAHETGLYLCPVGPARLFARPVLIPWSRVGLPEGYAGGDRAAGSREVSLQVGAQQVPFVVPRNEWDRVRILTTRALARVHPGPR